MSQKVTKYEKEVKNHLGVHSSVEFINGTVKGIYIPGSNDEKSTPFNGHNLKHPFKYQTLNTPDGLIFHTHGPLEGHIHYLALFVRRNIEVKLREVLQVQEDMLFIKYDCGCNTRDVLEVPLQGGKFTDEYWRKNRSTAAVRVKEEWSCRDVKL